MKIKLLETIKEEKEIEIEFPIYRKLDVDSEYRSITIYTRIDQPGDKRMREVNILIDQNNRIEIELDNNYLFNQKDTIDYNLGRGQYASTKEEFDEAEKQAQKLLAMIKDFELTWWN